MARGAEILVLKRVEEGETGTKFLIAEKLEYDTKNIEKYVEFRMRTKEHTCIWVLARGKVIRRDNSGKPLELTGTAVDISERKWMEEELQQSQEHLKQLNQQVVTAQEKERQRLSRELHDEIGQALTALKIVLGLIKSELTEDQAILAGQLGEAINLTGETLEQLRNLAHDLRPPALDTLGLNLTLEDYCREFGRRTHTNITYSGGEISDLSGEIRITLYRFVQEALTNVVKHALANRVWVTLGSRNNLLILTINDDGVGFPNGSNDIRGGIGLSGMQERLEMLGGKLTVESVPGQGSTITATLRRM
jgi:two-component system sensor histidine kinase UhpB